MKKCLVVLGVVAMMASPALAAVGESWILPVDHRDGGGWTVLPGAGYNGADAYSANTIDGTRRIYWELSGIGSMGNTPPATTELYVIEWFRPTQGNAGWQPIESQIRGVDGEIYPNDPLIPWDGQYGTNHQWIKAENGTPGTWTATGPGPHTPESDDFYALGDNGIYMWLGGHTSPSWLYAKWDFGFAIDHAWSALRVTQITPEPTGALLVLAGIPLLLRRKRRA